MKTKIEFEVDVPERWEFVRLASIIETGEHYMVNGRVEKWLTISTSLCYPFIILRPKPEPLQFPPELMGFECAGIAMDDVRSNYAWWMYSDTPAPGDHGWEGAGDVHVAQANFLPCISRLAATVKERGLTWRQTWIPKPKKPETHKCENCGKDIGTSLWGFCSGKCLDDKSTRKVQA